MEILSLNLYNFMSYKEVSLPLANRGLLLIEGENGVGKSTLFEGVYWGLFGNTLRGLRSSQVVRRGSGGDTLVHVALSLGDRNVDVYRCRQHSKYANKLLLYINGADRTASSDSETQLLINQLIQLDKESFPAVVMFPQGWRGFAAFTDAEQKHILDRVLGMQRFSTAQEVVKRQEEKLQGARDRMVNRLKGLDARIQDHCGDVERLQREIQQFAQAKAEKTTVAQAVVDSMSLQRPVGPQVDEEVDRLSAILASTDIDAVRHMYQTYNAQLSEARVRQAEIHGSLTAPRRYIEYTTPVDVEAEVVKQAVCPTCGQDMPAEAVAQFRRTVEDQHQATCLELERQKEAVQQGVVHLHELDEAATGLQNQANAAQEGLNRASKLESQLRELNGQQQLHQQELVRWQERLQEAKNGLAAIQAEQCPYYELLENLQVRMKLLEVEQHSLSVTAKNLERELEYASFWVRGFGNRGVKSLLLDTITPYWNERANTYLRFLTDGLGEVVIDTQTELVSGEKREKLQASVSYRDGSNQYKGISGGEKRRADIAILLSLGDLATTRALSPVQLRMLDEPFERLDESGCEMVVQLLMEYVVPNVGTVLVMSHDSSLKSLFEQRVSVVKESGISRIIE